MKGNLGWRATFFMLTISTGLAGVPILLFMLKEIREYRKQKRIKKVESVLE